VWARVNEHRRQAQRQTRQAKGKRENRYAITVMSLNKEGCVVPLPRKDQRMHLAFSWSIIM
jgi:hypothetical protein